jgi:hypothetical protein
VEQAIRSAEADRWTRSNPEARSRAEGLVAQLESAIAGLEADLERARVAGKPAPIAEIEQALASRREWLDQARRSLTEFTG